MTQGSGPAESLWQTEKERTATRQPRAFGLRGLAPTRQRAALAGLLFKGHDRHVSAEALHAEATKAGVKVSLATVYNTLHQFTDAGLLQQVVVDASRSYFDTNVGDHQHFFCPDEATLIDIPGNDIKVSGCAAGAQGNGRRPRRRGRPRSSGFEVPASLNWVPPKFPL